jgi:hypothetical protein
VTFTTSAAKVINEGVPELAQLVHGGKEERGAVLRKSDRTPRNKFRLRVIAGKVG